MSRYDVPQFVLISLLSLPTAGVCRPASATETGQFEIQDGIGNILIASDEIRSYDWATHTLTLLPRVRSRFVEQFMKASRSGSGTSFAVVVGKETLYEGKITCSESSQSFSTPVLLADMFPFDSNLHEDQLQIQTGYPNAKFFAGKDPRADERIYTAPAAPGKLADRSAAHVAWVAASLHLMQSIKPGMTRAVLRKVFNEEGGSIAHDATLCLPRLPLLQGQREVRPGRRSAGRWG